MDHPTTDPPAPDGAPDEALSERRRRGVGCFWEVIETVALTFIIFFVIQNFIAQPFQVEQHSMERTFAQGDYVLVDRLSHLWNPYSRGQVVVFKPPPNTTEGTDPFIKRVIGVAGDTVEVRDGRVVVNGVALDEPYLYRDAAGDAEPTTVSGPSRWVVPAGDLFVMGDHRRVSEDSRVFGPIPVATVLGRGVVRYWPLSSFTVIATPAYASIPAP